MRTVASLLERMGACDRALKKYANSGRAFKRSFIEAHWMDARWFGYILFSHCPLKTHKEYIASRMRYPMLPSPYGWPHSPFVDCVEVGELFKSRKNRVEYWPDVKKRLQQIGVKL